MQCLMLTFFSLLSLALCHDSKTYNVGTALFRDSDTTKNSWTKEEVALLDARRLMQDLIPGKPMDTQTSAYISELTAYVRKSAETTYQSSEGRVRTLMLMALYDVMGGYLRAYALPITRLAYYAGTVRYDDVEVLNGVYGQIKTYLRTDGSTWSSDMGLERIKPFIRRVKISPVTPADAKEACEHLIVDKETASGQAGLALTVATPRLDDPAQPSTIAVPLRDWPRMATLSPGTDKLFLTYYVSAIRCLAGQPSPVAAINNFHDNLNTWMTNHMIPHLKEERWYPGLHGVLQIMETMRSSGANGAKEALDWLWKTRSEEDAEHHSDAMVPQPPPDTRDDPAAPAPGDTQDKWIVLMKNVYIVYICGACLLLIAVFLTICCFCCCKKLWIARRKRNVEKLHGGSSIPVTKNIFGWYKKGYERLANGTHEDGRITLPSERSGFKVSLKKQYREEMVTAGSSNMNAVDGGYPQSSHRCRTVQEFEEDFNTIIQKVPDIESLSPDSDEEEELYTTTL